MPTTALRLKEQIRDRLDEPSERQWTDRQLRSWANEGMKDIARRSGNLRDTVNVAVTAGNPEYTVAANVLNIHQAYYVPTGDTRRVPLAPRQYSAMENVWLSDRDSATASTPSFFTVWGFSPLLKLRIWPNPTVGGVCQLFVDRLPVELDLAGASEAATNVDLPEGWVDLVIDYVEFTAQRKDRDPRWQEAKALYEQKLGDLMASTDGILANQEIVFDSRGNNLPAWLVGGDDWGYF